MIVQDVFLAWLVMSSPALLFLIMKEILALKFAVTDSTMVNSNAMMETKNQAMAAALTALKNSVFFAREVHPRTQTIVLMS